MSPQPTQVFALLEALYGAYDVISQRRGVFKVETIGEFVVLVYMRYNSLLVS